MLKYFRKYYLPGMISLLGIFIYSVYSVIKPVKKEKTLEIIYSDDNYQFSNDKQFLNTINKSINYVTLNRGFRNIDTIKNIFKRSSESDFQNYLVFDISNILYQDFVEIINQCKIYGVENCYSYKDTIVVGDSIIINHKSCGPSYNLINSPIMIPPLQKLVFENGKVREVTKLEAIWIEYKADFKRFFPFAVWIVGMLFFYYILPFIQSKISSKETTALL